jgi:hypothetical protein
MNMNLSYTVLQAALILTITIPLYINVPEFSSASSTRAFSAVVGFSAFSHVLVLLGCTIQTIFRFYKKCCDMDGQLKDKYIEMLRKDMGVTNDDKV